MSQCGHIGSRTMAIYCDATMKMYLYSRYVWEKRHILWWVERPQLTRHSLPVSTSRNFKSITCEQTMASHAIMSWLKYGKQHRSYNMHFRLTHACSYKFEDTIPWYDMACENHLHISTWNMMDIWNEISILYYKTDNNDEYDASM